MYNLLFNKLNDEFPGTVSVTAFNYETKEILFTSSPGDVEEFRYHGFTEILKSIEFVEQKGVSSGKTCISVWEERGILRAYKLYSERDRTAVAVTVNSDITNVGIILRILTEKD